MRDCRYCNKPIPKDSEFCSYCGKRVEVEKFGPGDISSIQEDIKEWRRDETVFTFFWLAFLVLGIITIWIDGPLWVATICFIALAFCLAMSFYSYRKVSDLKRRLRGQ